MAPPYSDPGSRPVPTLPALSLRAVGYHMPPFVHSGGDTWVHPLPPVLSKEGTVFPGHCPSLRTCDPSDTPCGSPTCLCLSVRMSPSQPSMACMSFSYLLSAPCQDLLPV